MTRGFVAKPASDGTNYGILVMTPERWRRENWTFALVSRHVERFLFKERSSWGQWYEQRGVVVQAHYTDDAPAGARWPNGMAEFNVLVQLGKPVHIRVQQIPKAKGTGCFDVLLRPNGTYRCLPTGSCPQPYETCVNTTWDVTRMLAPMRLRRCSLHQPMQPSQSCCRVSTRRAPRERGHGARVHISLCVGIDVYHSGNLAHDRQA